MSEVDELFKQLVESSGMDLALDRILEADTILGSPSQRFRSVHVAGTNGKGTVTTKIANTLTAMGYKTGLFTSPHINTFRERIQIDGKLISEEEALLEIKSIMEVSRSITFFEIMALLAFIYFDKNGVDYAIFETGLGGEKDATNILRPDLTVITNISNDHSHILGETLDEISVAKAGIIKPQTPVVLGYRARRKPILKAAFDKRAPIYFVKQHDNIFEENTAIAKRALKVLLSAEDVDVSSKRPPCRFEEHNNTIFDVAHNEDGVEKLFTEVRKKYKNRKIFTIFSLSTSKDLSIIIPFIKAGSDHLFYYEGNHPRLAPYEEVKNYLPGTNHTNIDRFIELANKENGIILVTGSFFIMNDLKEKLGIIEEKDRLLLCD